MFLPLSIIVNCDFAYLESTLLSSDNRIQFSLRFRQIDSSLLGWHQSLAIHSAQEVQRGVCNLSWVNGLNLKLLLKYFERIEVAVLLAI